MKKIRVTAKKLLAILLCLLMAASMAVPAFAEGPAPYDPNRVKATWRWKGGVRELIPAPGNGISKADQYQFLPQTEVVKFFANDVDRNTDLDYLRNIQNGKEEKLAWLLNEFYGREETKIKEQAEASMKLTTVLKSYFNNAMKVVQGVSAVMSMVTSTLSILKAFGIPEDKQATSMSEQFDNIIKDIQELQATVDEINRKTDEIQNTLTNEFADIDLRLQQQDYLHYKDDVWAKFYSDAVVPLNTLQSRYSDNVTMQMVNYVEQWQNGSSKTDLRSLFGRNDEGELIQVFSGNNLIGAGERLNAAPKISMDEIPVDYAVTLPAEYISANIDKTENINSGTCIDTLTEAVEKGVYAAAEDGKLSAYRGFYDEWNAYTEEEKKAEAKTLAAYLADTVAFEAAYETANEKSFASSVKTAYQNFALWLMGNDSLTSPLFAQLKMLSLTHAFEGEIIDQANDVAYYICMMNLNFCSFAEMVVSMSKAHNDDDSLDIRDLYMMSETNMSVDYSEFITGNPNYRYQTEQVLEYKPAVVESTVSFIYDEPQNPEYIGQVVNYDEHFSNTGWQLFEKDGNYASRDEKAKSQQDLLSRSITTIDAKVIYAMYTTSGFEGTFGEYLAYNKVITDADKVTDRILTTFTSSALDLRSSTDLTCHWAVGVGEYGRKDYENGKKYAVPGDKLKEDSYVARDKVTGGVFDLVTGNSDENALAACRTFYGDGTKIFAFSNTDYSFKREKLSRDKIEELHLEDRQMANTLYTVTGTYSADYGMFVSAEAGTYTFPAGTKTIPDNYFPSSSMIEKLIFDGTPDTIADNAFEGVGSKTYRCLLKAPFETGSLAGEWHGGYFGNAEVTLDANDGTGTTEKVVVVSSAPISNILNTFDEENRTFLGWSRFPNGAVVNPNEKMDSLELRTGVTLYAVWKYDHEHDFEVTAEGKPATCTEDGFTEEKTCKICGYVEYEVLPATGHTCTYTKSEDNYIAECSTCGYKATLYPKECGCQTVWGEAQDGSGIVYISAIGMQGTHIGNDGIYVIKSNQHSTQSLLVYDGLNVSICFDGVDFAGNYGKVGFDAGKSNVNLTLKGENSITTLDVDTFVSAGNLTIDGDGSLLLTSNYDDNTYYNPGVPFNTTGAHTVIKGGNICAMGGDLFSVMINDDVTNGDLVIEQNACFYAEYGIDTVPVNGDGEKVYPLIVDNPNEYVICIEWYAFPFRTLPGQTFACIYLTRGDHFVNVGNTLENVYTEDPVVGGSVLEKQYGDFTVLNPNDDEKAVEYSNGVLTVKKSTPITIKNTDPSTPTTDRIVIAKDISADITLDGVSIQTEALIGKDAITPIMIEDDSTANVIITLAEGSENVLAAGNNMAAIRKNGTSGTLTIEGSGSLSATSGQNAAAIGSTPGNTAAGIIINGGNIVAQTSGEGAAAIGAGKNEYIGSSAVAKDITINGGTVTAICGQSTCAIGGAKAENIKINGGIVTAKSSVTDEYESFGGIGGCPVVVENTASVKAPFVESPVNGKGRSVELNTITVTEGKSIVIDGALFPYTSHNGENTVYIYLAKTEKQDYTPSIDVEENERGTVTYSPKAPKAGDKVTLYALENEGYSFGKFTISPEIEIDEDNSFIMPDEAVTIGAVFNRIGTVTVKDCVNGTIIPSKTSAPSGETITLCVIPDEGMKLSSITVSPESAVLTGKKFVMPEEDVTVSCTCEPREYTVTWDVNGEKTTEKVKFGEAITAPEDPAIEGYNFIGWTPDVAATMPAEDVEYFAVFSTDPYVAEFKADSKTVAKVPYTMDDKSVKEPAVPEKVGYTGKWEAYTLAAGGITVNAVYTPVEYKARFVANGELVDTVAYTMNTVSITEPEVPEKSGYTGAWSDYALTVGGIIVKAVYTPDVHEHSFDTEYSSNEVTHWHAALCDHDVVSGLAMHTFGEGVVKGDVTEYTCTVCEYVKTVTNAGEDTEDLATIIKDAKAAVDKAAADGDDTVKEYADEAKTEIGKAVSGSEVTKKLAEAINTINEMKTEKAAADALDTLDSVTASTSKSQSIVRMAKMLIGEAKSPEEIDAILADALTKIEAAESAEAEVTEAKNEAKEAIAEKAGEKQSDEMKSIVSDVEAVIDAAQTTDQVAAAKALGEAAVQAQLDKEAADASLDEAKTSLADAEKALEDLETALKEAEDKLKDANEALEQTKKDLETAEGDIEAKNKALEEAEKNLADAQAELEETRSQLADKAAALETAQANLATANEAFEKANEQVEALTAGLEKVNNELAETKNALNTANEQVTALTAELNKANENLEKAESDLAAANAEISTLTADLKKANDELAETKTALDKAEADLETAKTEKANLETQLADKETELENLRKSGEAKDEEISALEEEIAGLEKAIETKDDEITEKTGEIAALEKSVDELEKTVEDKDKELAEKTDAVKALEKSVADLENEVKDKEDEIAEKEKTIGDLEKSISNLEASVQAKETEVSEKTEEIKKLENSVEDLEDEIAKAQKDLADKNSQIEELTEQLEKAKAEIEELKNGSGEQEDEPCPKCGKFHKDNFWGKIVCFFNRVFNFFRDLFRKIF